VVVSSSQIFDISVDCQILWNRILELGIYITERRLSNCWQQQNIKMNECETKDFNISLKPLLVILDKFNEALDRMNIGGLLFSILFFVNITVEVRRYCS